MVSEPFIQLLFGGILNRALDSPTNGTAHRASDPTYNRVRRN